MSAAAKKSPKVAAAIYVPRHRRAAMEEQARKEAEREAIMEDSNKATGHSSDWGLDPSTNSNSPTPTTPQSRASTPRAPKGRASTPNSSRSADPKTTPSSDGPTRKGRGSFKSPIQPISKKEERTVRREPARVYPKWQGEIESAKANGWAKVMESRSAEEGSPRNGQSPNRSPAKKKQSNCETQNDAHAANLLVENMERLSVEPAGSGENGDGSPKADGDWASNRGAGYRAEDSESDESEAEWEQLDDDQNAGVSTAEDKPKREKLKPEVRQVANWEETELLEGPTTVLEVFDFPTTFRTQDVDLIFQDFDHMRGGYRIKWLGHSNALIIFQHPDTAKSAYATALSHPFVKVKPFTGKIPGDIRQDRERPPRPVTTDMVARRLVAGALGVRSTRKTQAEAALDKQKLQYAKDKRAEEKRKKETREKELAAAWEG